jgi:hypothetical protein
VIDYGTCEGQEGCWVEDDQTFEEGFVPEYDDAFWTMDEYGYWSARPFQGRRLCRGAAKGKGKGGKGRRRFTPHFKKRGKGGKGKGHYPENEYETAAWTGKGKGKGKGKNPHKGKGKPQLPQDGKGMTTLAARELPTMYAIQDATPPEQSPTDEWGTNDWSHDDHWWERRMVHGSTELLLTRTGKQQRLDLLCRNRLCQQLQPRCLLPYQGKPTRASDMEHCIPGRQPNKRDLRPRLHKGDGLTTSHREMHGSSGQAITWNVRNYHHR